ncbi:MAG: T9SS type A sorting domain-containing protein [Chitinophagaceae bacterium]|nr:T9SS type A sorting domain-containing protein [Chitinophagaceae bacterium]
MKRCLLAIPVLFFSLQSFSQLLSTSPVFPVDNSPVTVTMDATKGNQGLLNYTPVTDVYVYTGVITNLSANSTDWRYVRPGSFNTPVPALQATSAGTNKWQFTIGPDIRTFYGVPAGETILKIAILFRNGSGSQKQANTNGSDMYIPVYSSALATKIIVPFIQPTFIPIPEPITKSIGNTIAVTGVSNIPATLKLYFNGSVVQTAIGATTISANPTIVVGGTQTLVVEANDGVTIKKDTVTFFVSGGVTIAPLPAGVKDGINYDPNNTSVTLVLYAPFKTRVSVIGEFAGSNWVEQSAYQMNQTADGNYWWIRINGLTPGTEYAFQYLVDGTLKIAEPYTDKVLDPNNDQFITPTTYPALKPYPTGLTTGIVSVLQTASPAYNWQVNSFTKPDKRNLMIYELLVRDFVAAHDWKTLRDTLNYIQKLGINTIEIMPFNEFEGNLSWGYNPDFYFAPDKYYGPKNTLKEFIDSAHKRGIAVVMDMVLNHSFGSSPMVQLYYDGVNNRPAANNPWFNPVAKHAFNVGYDMNHESLATRYFVSRVVDYWLNDYKIDGFRFDLSKGFTQTQTCDANGANCDVNAWGAYDASRVAIWERYYDTIQIKSPGAYAILEHFADNSEETVLSNYGLMLWGNMNYNYNQATMGYSAGWDFSYGIHSVRGWTNPYLVTYMESHDEERLMYKNITFGNSNGSYVVSNLATALKRNEMAGAFFFPIPGPKMIWQFGEMGYDYSINTCSDGVTINNNCRTDSKPIRWDYLLDANRKHLHDVYASLMLLRNNPQYKNTFLTGTITENFSSGFKWLKVSQGTGNILVVGDFDVVPQSGTVTFQNAGTWYDYLTGTTITATGAAQLISLQPGEYHVYLNTNVALPVTLVNFAGKNSGSNNVLTWMVANELNLDYYQLQRSTDGHNFTDISKITATGNSSYSYNDNVANNNASFFYYRLKSVDKDGHFSYSAVVKIKVLSNGWFAVVTPNPFTDAVKINIETAVQDKGSIILTDLRGRRLMLQNITLAPGTNSFELNNMGRFATGTYMLSVNTTTETKSFKVVKGK